MRSHRQAVGWIAGQQYIADSARENCSKFTTPVGVNLELLYCLILL
jgi:hypothetical protein